MASIYPPRVLLLIPKEIKHEFLIIARLHNAPVFGEVHHRFDLTLALAANKESMFRDPVNWSSASARLKEWSSQVEIPPLTDALFRERIAPSHKSRASSLNQFSLQMKADHPSVYSFHRPLSNPVDKKQLSRCCLPPQVKSALANINKHNFSLAALVILPNHFRKLWIEKGDPEAALERLRWTFFWGGYQIWKARKALVTSYWKSVGMKPKKRKSAKDPPTACKNSFHFLVKHADLSKQRLTKCPCSRVRKETSSTKSSDITSFFIKPKKISQHKRYKKYQQHTSQTDRLDIKHIPKVPLPMRMIIKSQDDIIRGEHDRGKKRRWKQLCLSVFFQSKGRL